MNRRQQLLRPYGRAASDPRFLNGSDHHMDFAPEELKRQPSPTAEAGDNAIAMGEILPLPNLNRRCVSEGYVYNNNNSSATLGDHSSVDFIPRTPQRSRTPDTNQGDDDDDDADDTSMGDLWNGEVFLRNNGDEEDEYDVDDEMKALLKEASTRTDTTQSLTQLDTSWQSQVYVPVSHSSHTKDPLDVSGNNAFSRQILFYPVAPASTLQENNVARRVRCSPTRNAALAGCTSPRGRPIQSRISPSRRVTETLHKDPPLQDKEPRCPARRKSTEHDEYAASMFTRRPRKRNPLRRSERKPPITEIYLNGSSSSMQHTSGSFMELSDPDDVNDSSSTNISVDSTRALRGEIILESGFSSKRQHFSRRSDTHGTIRSSSRPISKAETHGVTAYNIDDRHHKNYNVSPRKQQYAAGGTRQPPYTYQREYAHEDNYQHSQARPGAYAVVDVPRDQSYLPHYYDRDERKVFSPMQGATQLRDVKRRHYQHPGTRPPHSKAPTPPTPQSPPPPPQSSVTSSSSSASDEPVYLDIGHGITERLRRVAETKEAVAKDFCAPAKCLGCPRDDLFVIADAKYMVCPSCLTVTPCGGADVDKSSSSNDSNEHNYDFDDHEIPRYGVGLGFTTYTLVQMQSEIFREYRLPSQCY